LVDRETARTKYGIPTNRRVVLFFAPFLNVGDYWRELVASTTPLRSRLYKAIRARKLQYIPSILLGDTIAEIAASIRRFCDRENAVLVVKSRGKQTGLETVESAADIFVDGTDDVYYPTFTGYELMATADLCIQTYSYSAVEAVIAALPTVCITTPRDYPLSQRDWRHTMAGELQFNNDSGGLFNYPGCVNSVEWSQAVRYFDQAKLEDFTINTDKRAEYISKFAGLGKESSSSKVLKVIHGS